jgi:hypothetical protein
MTLYARLADLVVLIHLAFVAFVVLGALVARGRPWVVRLHVAALAYAVAIAAFRWVCPLTYVELWLRARGTEASPPLPAGRTFIERIVEPFLYADIPPVAVLVAAILVAAVSLLAYRSAARRA